MKKEIKTNVMRLLDAKGISYKPYFYECKEFIDGISIANELGQPHELVYKTLVTKGKGNTYFVFVIPIEAELDMKKAAKAVNEKALEMLPLKNLTAVTGYIRGGCTAIGMKKQFPTIIDESASCLEQMIVSGGKVGIQLEVSPKDWKEIAVAEFAHVIK